MDECCAVSLMLQAAAVRVTHADFFVAERFTGWEERVLQVLQGAYQAETKVRLLAAPLPALTCRTVSHTPSAEL